MNDRHPTGADIVEEGLREGGPSLGSALRALWRRHEDPELEVDIPIAATMAAVLWIGGAVLAALMLGFLSPPTRTLGSLGWLAAGLLLAAGVAMGVERLRRPPPGLGSLFAGTLVALACVALLEWLAGGGLTPFQYLYALPLLYAAAVQPRGRALVVAGLVCAFVWSPLLYAPAAPELPRAIAGHLLLLLAMAIAARLLFTLLRAQRAGLKVARREAEHLARRDPLTGLGNRLSLEEALEVEVARARRHRSPLTLIVGDLDAFKEVNDDFGHATGDDCLRDVARAISNASRAEDQCFRWGGDEFAIVLPDTSGVEAADAGRRVSEAASRACSVPDGRPVRFTCGTAELEPGDGVAELIAKADRLLLAVKRSKRGQPGASADGGSRPEAQADRAPNGGKPQGPAGRRI